MLQEIKTLIFNFQLAIIPIVNFDNQANQLLILPRHICGDIRSSLKSVYAYDITAYCVEIRVISCIVV